MDFPFPNLFSKGKIGKTEIRNRIVMLPMSTNFPNENGGVTNELIDYYAERAKGEVGLVIVESACVDFPVGRNGATKLRCDQPVFVPGLSRLVDAVHSYGAKVIIQVQHAGSSTSLEKTFGHQPVAPSTVYDAKNEVSARGLSVDDIRRIESEFIKVARYAKEAGFDGVEVHGAHSYLIAQFLSPICNKRTDEYGGDLPNRTRFLLEIVEGIRKEVGPRFIIAVRINGDELTEGGNGIEQSKEIALLLEEASVDMLDISSGLKNHADGLSMFNAQGWRVHLAEEIKKSVHIPVIASGGLRDPEFAESVLSSGKADFIGLGRSLIADPFWAQKAARGEQKKIRMCISCNVGCAERRIGGYRSIKCTVNPDVGLEGRICFLPPGRDGNKKVVVIGAGPAGLNAAMEAAKRGYSVDIFEKGEDIGGMVNLAAIPPFKGVFKDYVDHLRESLKEHDISFHFNKEATLEDIRKLDPQVVICATGSRPIIPYSIPGVENDNVITAHDFLRGDLDIAGKKVVVLGGGSIGCEVADLLAEKNDVTIVEMASELAVESEKINRRSLLRRLEDGNVKVLLCSRLEEIGRDSVSVREKDTVRQLPSDYVILSVGVVPARPGWIDDIRETGADVLFIGDAGAPGRLINAVSEGAAVGRSV